MVNFWHHVQPCTTGTGLVSNEGLQKSLKKIELHLLKESNRSEVLSNSEVFVTLAHKENLIVAKNDKKNTRH